MNIKTLAFFLLLIFPFSIFSQSAKVDFLQNVQKSGISFYWDPLTSSGLLEKNGHRISFRAGDY